MFGWERAAPIVLPCGGIGFQSPGPRGLGAPPPAQERHEYSQLAWLAVAGCPGAPATGPKDDWRAGPVRLGMGLSVFSEASWSRVDYRHWTVLPTLGLGFGR